MPVRFRPDDRPQIDLEQTVKWFVLFVMIVVEGLTIDPIRLRVSPTVVNDGGKVTVTCVVPAMNQRLRVWIGIQNVQESEIAFDSERPETFIRTYPVFCGAGEAYCVLSTGQSLRRPITVGGCS